LHSGMNGQKCILVAEDREDDLVLLRHSFQKAGLSLKIEHAWNGEVALDYLTGAPPFSDREKHPFPDLILLDIKMPRKDGFEVLRQLQSHREWKALPVVVLTSSFLEEDKRMALRLGARAFMTKPVGIHEYHELVEGLRRGWLDESEPGDHIIPKVMRIVLRNYQTGDFFQIATGEAEKRWTQKQSEALGFADQDAAIRVARELRLQNVEVLHLNAEGRPLLGTRIDRDYAAA
jgi:CheY-like chemotaxis protein